AAVDGDVLLEVAAGRWVVEGECVGSGRAVDGVEAGDAGRRSRIDEGAAADELQPVRAAVHDPPQHVGPGRGQIDRDSAIGGEGEIVAVAAGLRVVADRS